MQESTTTLEGRRKFLAKLNIQSGTCTPILLDIFPNYLNTQNLKQATLPWVRGKTRHLNIPGMVSLETSLMTTL